MKPGIRVRRVLWSAVVFLALIGSAVAVRRVVHLVPIAVRAIIRRAQSNPAATQFARWIFVCALSVSNSVHMCRACSSGSRPLQFSSTIRARHLRWHRWSGRIFVICSVVIGISALVMSFGMPAIGGLNQAAETTLFATFFLFALCKAFWHIGGVKSAAREWMIRAFRLGLPVATIRPSLDVLCYEPLFRPDAPRIFRHWILDRLCPALIAAEAWIHTRAAAENGCRCRNNLGIP